MKIILAFFISFLLSTSGFCSVKNDTIPKPKVIAHRFNYDFTSMDSVPIDTVLHRFQVYSHANAFKASNPTISDLNAPIQPLDYANRMPYQDFLFTQYSKYYIHNSDDILYYSARKPYTIINYEAVFPALKNEQKLNIIHTQNVNTAINLGAIFDLNYEFGTYINQKTSSNGISLFGSYQGKRYSIYGNVNSSKIKYAENGGVLNDTLYSKFSYSAPEYKNLDIRNIQVNLSFANSLTKEQSLFIIQRFYLTGSYKDDSIRNKSKWNEALSVIHQLRFQRTSRTFNDFMKLSNTNGSPLDSGFYSRFNLVPKLDRDTTLDSVYFRRFENIFQLAFNTKQWLNVPAELRIGLKSQLDYTNIVTLDTLNRKYTTFSKEFSSSSNSYINTALVANLINRFSRSTSWGASLEYYLTDYKANDLDLRGDISQSIRKNFIMRLSGHYTTTEPGYFLKNFKSNYFNWSNKFDKQKNTNVKLSLAHLKSKFFIDAQLDLYNNYVYLNDKAIPQQINTAFIVSSVTISKLIDWGIFHTDIRGTVQKTFNDNNNAISIPEFSGYNSTYLALQLFKKEMKLNFGYDLYYNTAYYADAYMPVTGLFYQQREVKLGNHPNTDVFVNFKVKRIRFFFKYERLNDLLFNQRTFLAPHYPADPTVSVPLKFGLSWTFYD